MRLFIFFLFFCSLKFDLALANPDCDPCEPLAQVAFTQEGIGRMYDIILRNLFSQIAQKVSRSVDFREIHLDCHSNPKNCVKLPDLSELDEVDGSMKDLTFHPISASVSQLKLEKLGMRLETPVKCENYQCQFEVGVRDLAVSGRVEAKYSDMGKNLLPPSEVRVESTPIDNLKYKFLVNIMIDPASGDISKLMRVQPNSTMLGLPSQSLRVSVRGLASQNLNQMLKNDPYEEQYLALKEKFKDKKWIEEQLRLHESKKFFSDFKKSVDLRLQSESFSSYCMSESSHERTQVCLQRQKLIEKEMEKENERQRQEFRQKYSPEKFIKIHWPSYSGEGKDFFNQLPEMTQKIPAATEQVEMVAAKIYSRQEGYDNVGSYAMVKSVEAGANQLLGSQEMISKYINPYLEKEFDPSLKELVNRELRNIQNYWNQIARVPNLDFALLEKRDRLRKEAQRLQDAIEKREDPSALPSQKNRLERVLEEISQVDQEMKKAWTHIDSKIVVDGVSRAEGLLSASLYSQTSNCQTAPAFAPKDQDYHMATQLGLSTIDKYFEMMAKQGKLSTCPDALERGCTPIAIKEKPTVSCKNGQYVLKFKNAQLTSMKLNANGEIRVSLSNCAGNPCFKMEKGKGQFNFLPLNLLFGSALNRSLSQVIKNSSDVPLAIPQVKLKDHKVDSQSCQTQLFWELNPPGAVEN